MGNYYAVNSFAIDPAPVLTETYVQWLYAMIAVSAFVLLHSWFEHRNREWDSVRKQTELAAATSLLSAVIMICLIYCVDPTSSDGATTWVVLYDTLYNGVFNATVQLCDNYMFFNRYRAVVRMTMAGRVSLHLFIWCCTVLNWLPAFTLIPLFYNVNSISFLDAFSMLLMIGMVSIVAYNFYFTFQFARILLRLARTPMIVTDDDNGLAMKSAKKIKSIAARSIIHCVSSSFATLVFVFIPTTGVPLYSITIVLCLHLLFNCRNLKRSLQLLLSLGISFVIGLFSCYWVSPETIAENMDIMENSSSSYTSDGAAARNHNHHNHKTSSRSSWFKRFWHLIAFGDDDDDGSIGDDGESIQGGDRSRGGGRGVWPWSGHRLQDSLAPKKPQTGGGAGVSSVVRGAGGGRLASSNASQGRSRIHNNNKSNNRSGAAGVTIGQRRSCPVMPKAASRGTARITPKEVITRGVTSPKEVITRGVKSPKELHRPRK